MRISDWSSDVCSSDLEQCGPDKKYRTLVALAGEPGADGEARHELRQHHRQIEHPHEHPQPPRVDAFAHDRERQAHDRAPADPGDPHQHEQGNRVARAHPRSEEHTSELQSIMRISYAVFCLKIKKIKKIDKTTNM